ELFIQMEMPLVYSLYYMEQEGIRVNKEALKQFSVQLSEMISDFEKEIYEEAGEEFNINSPKQLGVILFEKLKLPAGKKTKTGYSTSADVLEKLADEFPIVNKILKYRQLTKLKSTYADGLVNYISEDNRIHGTFNQTITSTGRISSTEPNLQNIPIRNELGQEIRKSFEAKEGCIFLDADYSQIELRLLAHLSADENLIESYKRDVDIHKVTASKVFNTPLDEVTKEQRSNAKAVNFGIVYGISSFGLSQGLSISKKEANEYIKQYFSTYPQVKEFLDNTVKRAKIDGYTTTMFGRIRPIPELNSSNFMQRAFGERAAMNAPIQGTAADIIKIAMVNVDRTLRKNGYRARIVLQIHDELLIEAPIDEAESVKELLYNEMKQAVSLKVPLEVEVNTGKDWFEAH
ncbi:MAG: DNA polymerase I, partial [Lachnospiraceae bacterium]|nr:DNA polymerase I [Lachnospiraceae bacterium]